MRSWWMQMNDADAVLELRETPVPQPGPHQLLVRMHAAALNRGEFVPGHGLHGKAGTWKAIGGEGAGEVVAVGAGVTRFGPGDRVMGRCAGAFSEHALMEEAEAIAAPRALSWEEAASIPLTFLVSYDMLVLQGRLAAGEWLLINGVSSGVGVASLQLGKLLGAKVIGTSGSADKLQALKAARAGRCAVHAQRRLRAHGHGGDRPARRGPRRQHGRRLRVRGERARAWLSRAASRPWATSTACCMPTSTSRRCTPSA